MQFTQEAGFAEIHVAALQAPIAMPGGNLITAITGDVHVQQVTVARNKHVHL